MRLSEMTDEQLIREVEDDALAREIFNRLVLSKLRVSDEGQALEHQRDKAQDDYEKAMDRVSDLESLVDSYGRSNEELQRVLNRGVTPYPPFVLRKQAEALDECRADIARLRDVFELSEGEHSGLKIAIQHCRNEAETLRAQADYLEQEGAAS